MNVNVMGAGEMRTVVGAERRWRFARCCAAAAPGPALAYQQTAREQTMARRWRLARGDPVAASGPMRRGGGVLPNAAQQRPMSLFGEFDAWIAMIGVC